MSTLYGLAMLATGVASLADVCLGQWDRATFFAVLTFWHNWNLRYFLQKEARSESSPTGE
jgi:hypothetical protein